MADKAVKIGQSLLDLIKQRPPTLPPSQWEVNYEIGSISSSPNKQEASNACVAVDLFNRKKFDAINPVIDWFAWKSVALPFQPKESTTPEDIYRSLPAFSELAVAAVAGVLMKYDKQAAIDRLALAHFAWALLGLGVKPARTVRDHHLQNVNVPCVLVGEGAPKYAKLRTVMQMGDRGWVRNRDGGPKVFMFTLHEALSIIVYLGLGWEIERKARKACAWQVDMAKAITDRWPGARVFGLDSSQRIDALMFANEPTNREHVARLVPWLKPTSVPTTVLRYADGSVLGFMHEGHDSSTDALMLNAAYSNGEIRLTSADDGLRIPAIRQDGWQDEHSIACRAKDGSGPTMRLPKPNSPLAWEIESDGQRTWMHP